MKNDKRIRALLIAACGAVILGITGQINSAQCYAADNTTTTGSGNCLINTSDFAKTSALNNLDSSAVHKSGNESITGVKTFNAVAVFNGDNTFNGINTFTTSSNSGISVKLKST